MASGPSSRCTSRNDSRSTVSVDTSRSTCLLIISPLVRAARASENFFSVTFTVWLSVKTRTPRWSRPAPDARAGFADDRASFADARAGLRGCDLSFVKKQSAQLVESQVRCDQERLVEEE